MEKLKTEDLKKGEVYFISYGGEVDLIMRFKELETTDLVLYSEIKTVWEKETFFKDNPWCVRVGITGLRAATQSETAKLEKYESRHGVPYVPTFIEKPNKRQEFFNFLNQEFELTCTESQMDDIVHEVKKALKSIAKEKPLVWITKQRLPKGFKQVKGYNLRYEKQISPKLVLGFYIDSCIYLLGKDREELRNWGVPCEETLSKVHKLFTGKKIKFKNLKTKEQISKDLIKEIQALKKQLCDQSVKIVDLEKKVNISILQDA